MTWKVLVLLLLVTAICGCGKTVTDNDHSPAAAVPAATATATIEAPVARPVLHEAAQATYSGIYDHAVTLNDGVFEGTPFAEGGASRPRVELVDGFELAADLDGDGTEETVVLLAESSGGSGTFGYLAVLARQDGGVANVATAPLGDRVQIRSWRHDSETIVVDVVQAGPEDAACCPSQVAVRRWTLGPDGLAEAPAEIEGELSLSILEGVEWRLASLDMDEEAPKEPEITLVIDGDRIAGGSGCNRYMGSISPGRTPGDVSVGPLAGTRMACPQEIMDLEQRFLGLLAKVSRFSFHLGRLALTSVDEAGTVHVMLLEAHPVQQQEG